MNPSPASVVAVLLVVAVLFLLVLTIVAVTPTTVHVGDAGLSPPEQQVRSAQRKHRRIERRVAQHRATPAPTSTPTRTPTPAPIGQPVAPPEQTAAEPAAPKETAVAPAAPPPADVVAAYYRALDAHRFEGAWDTLSPTVHEAFGGFEHWRTGYATTVASRPQGIAVERDGSVASVAHELITEDSSPCGPVRRRFDVRWRLVLGTGGWRASSLTAVKRSGPEPGAVCRASHDSGGVVATS